MVSFNVLKPWCRSLDFLLSLSAGLCHVHYEYHEQRADFARSDLFVACARKRKGRTLDCGLQSQRWPAAVPEIATASGPRLVNLGNSLTLSLQRGGERRV